MVSNSLWSFAAGALGGTLGWFATAFLARPIRKFFDLRGEAKSRMLAHWNAPTMTTPDEHSDEALKELRERRLELDDIGARLASFDKSEWLAARLVRLWGCDLVGAGKALHEAAIQLGTLYEDRDKSFRRVDEALKFYVDKARPFYDPYNVRSKPPRSK